MLEQQTCQYNKRPQNWFIYENFVHVPFHKNYDIIKHIKKKAIHV